MEIGSLMPSAVVLLSGGLDLYTAAALLRRDGFDLHALSVVYGQRHVREIESARRVAQALGARQHLEVSVDLARIGGSALTSDMPVPKDRAIDTAEIPTTYVPARNTVFLSLALAWAEVVGAHDIAIGANALDYSGYPDCRPELPAGVRAARGAGHPRGRRGRRSAHPRPAAAHEQGRHHSRWPRARPRLRADTQLLRSRARWASVPCLRQLCAACKGLRRGRVRGSSDRSKLSCLSTDVVFAFIFHLASFIGISVHDGAPLLHRLLPDHVHGHRDRAGRSPGPCGHRARSHRLLSDVRRPAVRYRTLDGVAVVDVIDDDDGRDRARRGGAAVAPGRR